MSSSLGRQLESRNNRGGNIRWLIVGLFLVGLLVAAAVFIGAVNVLVWAINDIAAHGAQFWNVFWIAFVAVVLLGSATHPLIRLNWNR